MGAHPREGRVRKPQNVIADALAAQVDQTKPNLGDKDSAELDLLVARWVAKCSRPQAITEDAELKELLARILELCKARMRYTLPVRKTLSDQLLVLGAEGRAVARDFIVRLLKSGVKPTITGDLWSESGMGLFRSASTRTASQRRG